VALGADSVGVKDPSGLLTPERARTLVPAGRQVSGDLPLEMHTHCRAGLGELVCLESVPLGVDIVHTGIKPLASGDALPDGRYVVNHLKKMGYELRVRDEDLREAEEYFTRIALLYDKPIGMPRRYDPFLYHHQVPGGMISNLCSQLRDMEMEDRLEVVLEEAGHVREDLGYPILVSPFAQFVITQAVINVVQSERYRTIPDEIVRYVLGYYGKPAGPVSPLVLDRVSTIAGSQDPIIERPGALVPPRIEKLKKERGPFKSDDDLLLHAFYQPSQLEPLFRARDVSKKKGAVSVAIGNPLKVILDEIGRLPKTGSVRVRQTSVVIDGYR
jgi:oxaloacetate decarboxylase (Na+ extruding) subunit alpha